MMTRKKNRVSHICHANRADAVLLLLIWHGCGRFLNLLQNILILMVVIEILYMSDHSHAVEQLWLYYTFFYTPHSYCVILRANYIPRGMETENILIWKWKRDFFVGSLQWFHAITADGFLHRDFKKQKNTNFELSQEKRESLITKLRKIPNGCY